MSAPVLAAVPFLGPAVAAWAVLIVGVMGFYFLSVSRQYRRSRVDLEPPARHDSPVDVPSPWWAGPGPLPVTPVAYDMENYPDDRWG